MEQTIYRINLRYHNYTQSTLRTYVYIATTQKHSSGPIYVISHPKILSQNQEIFQDGVIIRMQDSLYQLVGDVMELPCVITPLQIVGVVFFSFYSACGMGERESFSMMCTFFLFFIRRLMPWQKIPALAILNVVFCWLRMKNIFPYQLL